MGTGWERRGRGGFVSPPLPHAPELVMTDSAVRTWHRCHCKQSFSYRMCLHSPSTFPRPRSAAPFYNSHYQGAKSAGGGKVGKGVCICEYDYQLKMCEVYSDLMNHNVAFVSAVHILNPNICLSSLINCLFFPLQEIPARLSQVCFAVCTHCV